MDTHLILVLIFSLLMLPGLAGVLIPIVPGIPYMFIVALVFGAIDKFTHLTGANLLPLAILTFFSLIVDYGAGVLGARFGGASKKSLIAGLVGFMVGLVLLPPFGGIAGLFAGIYGYEMLLHSNRFRALKAAKGGVLGTLAGMVINALLAITFLILFILYAAK